MLVHLQPNVLLFDRSEALRFHSNRVVPDGQQWHEVVAAFVGFRLAGDAGALDGGFNLPRKPPIRSCRLPCRKNFQWLGHKEVDRWEIQDNRKERAASFLVIIKLPFVAAVSGGRLDHPLRPTTSETIISTRLYRDTKSFQDFLGPKVETSAIEVFSAVRCRRGQ